MSEEAKWYVVHTYSGYENKVAKDIEKVVENRKLQDLIPEVKVPTEIVTEVKEDKRSHSSKTVEVEKKLFPSYVLVKMVLTDDSWYIVRNTRGVTGFVGPASKPVPLTDKEVRALGVETKRSENITVSFKVGDNVEVTTGSFEGFAMTCQPVLLVPRQNGTAVFHHVAVGIPLVACAADCLHCMRLRGVVGVAPAVVECLYSPVQTGSPALVLLRNPSISFILHIESVVGERLSSPDTPVAVGQSIKAVVCIGIAVDFPQCVHNSSCIVDSSDVARLVIRIGDVLHGSIRRIVCCEMAQPLQCVITVMCVCAIAVPLPGFHFELVVTDAVDVVVIVVVVGGPFAHHGCVQFMGVVCGGAVALSRDERVERSGHNGVVARRETSTPIHLSEHTSRVVLVVHNFTVRVGDVLYSVPAVVGVFHLERIGLAFIWKHKSTIIFRHFAHPAVKKMSGSRKRPPAGRFCRADPGFRWDCRRCSTRC